jgi:Protein kinase domain
MPHVASTPRTTASAAKGLHGARSLPLGARLAEFEITQRIGEGGFSIVYLAWDHALERRVALKEYMPASIAGRVGGTQISARSQRHRETYDAGLRGFINEAKLLAKFDHPSLVKVYRYWEANGTAYMVMPYCEGRTLKDEIEATATPPDEAWLLALLAPLTEALLVIHADQCYHRDISPDNVILLADSGAPLLLDFGAARREIGDMTQAFTVILKQGYAPLEQYAGLPGMQQGPWTDVYALAAVVYWLITGSKPAAAVARMMEDSQPPLAETAAGRYSAPFLHAIDRALAVFPEQRTPSVAALRSELGLDSFELAGWPPMRGAPGDSADAPRPAADAAHARLPAANGVAAPRRARVVWGLALGVVAATAVAIWALPRGAPAASAVTRPALSAASAQPATVPAAAATASAAASAPLREAPAAAGRAAAHPSPAAVAASPGKAKDERRPAPVAGNSGECSRIVQRLSVGESDPHVLERYKALNCR